MAENGNSTHFQGDDDEIVKVEIAPGMDVLAWVGIGVAFLILGAGILFLVITFG